MLSRRLIRIKVFKVLFSRVHSQNWEVPGAEEELLASLDKTRQLYFLFLALPGALTAYAQERIDIGLQKFHPSEEEAHPNLRFVQNKAIASLMHDKVLRAMQEQSGLNWVEQRPFIKKLFEAIKEQDYFKDYMNAEKEPDFADDVNLLKYIFTNELDDNPELMALLEEMSLFWVDDVAYVCNVVLDKLSELKPVETQHVIKHPKLFRAEDDQTFAEQLLAHALKHYDEYVSYVEKFADHWDMERIAATDMAIIVLGVSEAVAFPSMPVKVTLNEMVELSKCYSTGNSKLFVNGMLDKIIKFLMQEGVIVKMGRGLVEK